MSEESMEERIRQRMERDDAQRRRSGEIYRAVSAGWQAEQNKAGAYRDQLVRSGRSAARELAGLLARSGKQPNHPLIIGTESREIRKPGWIRSAITRIETPITSNFWLVTTNETIQDRLEHYKEGSYKAYSYHLHGIALDAQGRLWTYRGPDTHSGSYRAGQYFAIDPSIPLRLGGQLSDEAIIPSVITTSFDETRPLLEERSETFITLLENFGIRALRES